MAPRIVTDVLIGPEDGERLVIDVEVSVNIKPLLASPDTETTTLPVTAPPGTGATICVSFQLVGLAATPANATTPDPCVEPKCVPAIVTEVVAAPEVGDRLVRCGGVAAAPML